MSGEKKRSTGSDAEYQYSEEDTQELPESARKPAFSLRAIKDKLLERLPKKKKSKIILMFFVAIYIVYKFLSSDESASPAAPVSASEKIASQSLSKPAVEIKPVKQTVAATKPIAKSTLVVEPEKNLNANDMHEEKSQINALQASLNQINQSMMTLESSLLSLTGSVIGLSNKMSALERMRQEEKITARQYPVSIYHLQSLVPERAWLQSSAGNLVTVKVGDILPGYGKIQRINTQTGVISTSSGRMIYYGPNDS